MNPTIAIPIITRIIQAAVAFRKALKDVKANKRQCLRLSERIESIGNCLKQLEEGKLIQKNMKVALDRLYECIHRCTTFISKFSGTSWFKHIFSHKEHHEEFSKFNGELAGYVIDLQL